MWWPRGGGRLWCEGGSLHLPPLPDTTTAALLLLPPALPASSHLITASRSPHQHETIRDLFRPESVLIASTNEVWPPLTTAALLLLSVHVASAWWGWLDCTRSIPRRSSSMSLAMVTKNRLFVGPPTVIVAASRRIIRVAASSGVLEGGATSSLVVVFQFSEGLPSSLNVFRSIEYQLQEDQKLS